MCPFGEQLGESVVYILVLVLLRLYTASSSIDGVWVWEFAYICKRSERLQFPIETGVISLLFTRCWFFPGYTYKSSNTLVDAHLTYPEKHHGLFIIISESYRWRHSGCPSGLVTLYHNYHLASDDLDSINLALGSPVPQQHLLLSTTVKSYHRASPRCQRHPHHCISYCLGDRCVFWKTWSEAGSSGLIRQWTS